MRSDFSLKTFPHQLDFCHRTVTMSSTARYSHENLVEKIKIFVQDFVPIKTALDMRCYFSVLIGK